MSDHHPVITVFEHQLLRWGDTLEGGPFTEAHWQALVQMHPHLPHPYYTLTHRGIKLSHYVGVLKAPYFTLEVLPKADKHPVPAVWRRLLIDLVAACASLTVDHPAVATPSFRAHSLPEVYLLDFVTQVERLFRQGLTKQYQTVTENCRAMKGRLRFAEHVRCNAVHQERFFVEHAAHTIDHPLHQLLKKALQTVKNVSSNPEISQRTRRLLHSLTRVSEQPPEALMSKKKTFNRHTERYRTAMTAAQQILAASFSHVYRGNTHQGFAFMLDMNRLFEEFVYRRLHRLSITHGFSVHRQTAQSLWGTTNARPDILVKFRDSRKNVVVDTKWKVLLQPRPSAEDLHQIYVYNQLFEAQRGILLYPQVHGLRQRQHRFGGPGPTSAEVHFIEIADARQARINPQLDQLLLQMLTPVSEGQ
jgi:5-methylcytosine-specific restriction enzyme subunit McrC